jgi:FlaA1/EpsC-like NDP-sugar epimerase
MSRYITRGIQLLLDLTVLSVAYWLAFLLRFEFEPTIQFYKLLFFTWPYVIVFQYFMLQLFGIPRFSWRYIGIRESVRILTSLSVATIVLLTLRLFLAPIGGYSKFVIIPIGIQGMDFILAFLGVTGIRVLRRVLSERAERGRKRPRQQIKSKATLLIGAGRAGVMVAKEVVQNPHLGINIVGFADDDQKKHGIVIHGKRVLGATHDLVRICEQQDIEQAIISIASAPGEAIRHIVRECEANQLPVKIIPGIHEILEGRVRLSQLRNVTIEDLLGREIVQLDMDSLSRFISNKCVVVTGAGGSIGSELCRLALRFRPKRLILIEQAENALFQIHSELRRTWQDEDIVPCVADICDAQRIDAVFEQQKPQVIFHAAAHKHVPMMEWNPYEAVKNNVFGTRTAAMAADRHGAESFVLISTDKAVNPTSVMGTTKRAAEVVLQGMSQHSQTSFMAVRFGNVLGSAGSVVPIFKRQIREGGPVTVTHPEMKRYFMTIPEACQLVIQAAAMGKGGEIFVLDMGEPVSIVHLAQDMVRLSGFSEEEIHIEFTGLRPGEKLFEELSTDSENMTKTRHPKIYIGEIEPQSRETIERSVSQLKSLGESSSREEVREALRTLVPEIQTPSDEVLPPTVISVGN